MKWNEIDYNKMKTFQVEDEPELIHVFKIRYDEYMVVFEDGYDLHTGKVEFHDEGSLKKKFGIDF